jgi:hypothetical protein
MYRAHCAQCGLAMHPAHAMMQTGAKASTVNKGGKARHDHYNLVTAATSKGHQDYHGDDPAYVHQQRVTAMKQHKEDRALARKQDKKSTNGHKHDSDEDSDGLDED